MRNSFNRQTVVTGMYHQPFLPPAAAAAAVAQDAKLKEASQAIGLRADRVVHVLHARQCIEGSKCSFAMCSKFRDLIRHMSTCNGGPSCTESACASTKEIMKHFDECEEREFCRICSRVLPRVRLNARGAGLHSVLSILPTLDPGRIMVYPFSLHLLVKVDAARQLCFFHGVTRIEMTDDITAPGRVVPLTFPLLVQVGPKKLPNLLVTNPLPWTVTVHTRLPGSSNTESRFSTPQRLQKFLFRVKVIEMFTGGQGEMGFILHARSHGFASDFTASASTKAVPNPEHDWKLQNGVQGVARKLFFPTLADRCVSATNGRPVPVKVPSGLHATLGSLHIFASDTPAPVKIDVSREAPAGLLTNKKGERIASAGTGASSFQKRTESFDRVGASAEATAATRIVNRGNSARPFATSQLQSAERTSAVKASSHLQKASTIDLDNHLVPPVPSPVMSDKERSLRSFGAIITDDFPLTAARFPGGAISYQFPACVDLGRSF